MARPRIHSPDAPATATQRMRASRARAAERGGRLVQIRLDAEEAAALARLREAGGYATDRDAIAATIRQAARPEHCEPAAPAPRARPA